jgi:tyrosyl-tRNA synthetase
MPAHLMNVMIPGLAGGRMFSSDPDSNIDFLDPPGAVRRKMQGRQRRRQRGALLRRGRSHLISELRLERAAR